MKNLINLSQEKIEEFRPLPFWSWNDKLEINKLLEQIDWMKENGIGGFFMHARSGLKTEYLSEEWMKCIDACTEYAKAKNMQAWVYDENGWPSGFVGGKLLEDCENCDRYLSYKIGNYDETATVSYIIDEEKLIRTTEDLSEKEYLNVYEHISSSTADVLNPEVVEKFLNLTHNQYKKRYGKEFSEKLKGFFTDEPQYYRWAWPYTKMVKEYFKEKYSEDILDNIGLLFVKKEGYRKFRYRYWSAMQELMINAFAKMTYEWCEGNGVKLTGHYIQENSLGEQMLCCGGIMPFYEYESIPGIDWLGRRCDNPIAARQVVSVAKQLSRDKVLGEIYACCGWDVTPKELKQLTEYLYANGLNISCQHLLPYSERGTRIHDFPAHYYKNNPWINENFKEFNDYFTNLGALFSEYQEQVRVAVIHPIKSCYFDYTRDVEDEELSKNEIDISLLELVKKLERNGINYHFIDETLLKKYGKCDKDKIVCGDCEYDYLIIPDMITLEPYTEQVIHSYIKNGGKTYVYGKKPSFIEWREYDYDYLKSNISFDDLLSQRKIPFAAEGGEPCVSYRSNGKKDIVFVINNSVNQSCKIKFDLGKEYSSFEKVCIYGSENKSSLISPEIELKAGESVLLVPSKCETAKAEEFEIVVPEKNYEIIESADNSYTVDKLMYSFDNVNYSKETVVPMAFMELLKSRYNGDLYLKYQVEINELTDNIYFNIDMQNIKRIIINGAEKTINKVPYESGNISKQLKKGNNEIIVVLNYFQSEKVLYALFGENVTESLKNCIVYDTEIDPLILKGDFGVFEKNGFTKGSEETIKIGNEFYIGKPKAVVNGLVENGYPFFAGKIKVKSSFYAKSDSVMLNIPGRWHIASACLNGKNLGKMMFDDTVDISDCVKKGNNELILEFVIGNRNVYGPHHYAVYDEPKNVGPEMFEFTDIEKKGKEHNFRKTMSFVEPLGW